MLYSKRFSVVLPSANHLIRIIPRVKTLPRKDNLLVNVLFLKQNRIMLYLMRQAEYKMNRFSVNCLMSGRVPRFLTRGHCSSADISDADFQGSAFTFKTLATLNIAV